MNTPSIFLASLFLASGASAAVVVNFDGYANSNAGFITTNSAWATSAHTTLATTNVADDTVRSTVPYGTTIATNGVGTYTGPTMRGGAYMNTVYNSAQIAASFGNWGQLINNAGGDYIEMRRNGASDSNAVATTRGVYTFATGGTYAFDATSSLTFMGGLGTSTSRSARWVVVNNGVTYISETVIAFINNGSTTPYTLANPAATNWSIWTPSADLGNLPVSFSVSGSSLQSITEVGFYFARVGSPTLNLNFRQFTADLAPATVPEPSAFAALAGLGALAIVSTRRRRG